MIKTILFASDLGVHTAFLLHHVNSIALQHNARVVVLHVMEPAGYIGDAMASAYLPRELRNAFDQEGMGQIIDHVRHRILDSLEEEYIDGHEGLSNIRDVKVLPGKPAEVILQEALSQSADMIIMGSHGGEVAGENMLGSVTSKVLQMSRVPVYMVPLIRNVMYHAKAS